MGKEKREIKRRNEEKKEKKIDEKTKKE